MAYNANFRNFGVSYRHGTVFAPKQYLHQKEALGMHSSKILSLGWCKKGTNLYGASNYLNLYIAIWGRQYKFQKFRGFLSPWYRVCTKITLISKRSFRDTEPINIILGLVQKGYKPLRGFKLPAFMFRQIGPTMQISGSSGLPIAMVPCLHQNSTYIKRKFRDAEVWYPVCAKRVPTSTWLQITRIHVSPYRADNATSEISGLLIGMVPCLHQSNIYIKRKL